jgi:hypothetical protein
MAQSLVMIEKICIVRLIEKPRFGKEITRSDKASLSKYLNYIDGLLSAQPK